MIRSHFANGALLAAAVCGLAAPRAAAQSRPVEQVAPVAVDRPYLERVALGRARARLAARVTALPLGDRQTIGVWAAQNLALDRSLRLWLRSIPKSGVVRIYSDGACDVDARVAPEEIVARLIELRDSQKGAPAGALSDVQIRQAAANWSEILCTGSSTVEDHNERKKKPVGWEDIAADGVQLCRHAALADAWTALLDQVGRLKVTPARRLEEFLSASDEIRQQVREAVEKTALSRVEFAPDQVALAEVQIGIPEFIRILTQVHQASYKGDEFKAADFREMALNSNLSELKAVGISTPPARYQLRARYDAIELDAPSWATSDLAAVGAYLSEDVAAQPEATQVELARLDGANNLRKQIERLNVQPGITVAEFLSLHQGLKDDVVLWLAGTQIAGKPQRQSDGVLRVKVELPADRLWQILRRGIHAVEVEPVETQPASSPASQPLERG